MTQLELELVIQRAMRGDRQAVAILYETFVRQIYRYVAYRVTNAADAEDLTAEIFVKMLEGLPGYRQTGAPFEAWLYRIAFSRIVDFHRRGRRTPQDVPEELPDDSPLPEETLLEKQELERLRAAIGALTDEQQQILMLRFIERKSHQEVAALVGRSVSAVKTIQHRALVELAARLGSPEKVRHYLRGGGQT
ncbi:MAG: sigma-70 family RNA polymerase sigma factor [Anaerolineae bacterium]|nr:sigma-70 family RNA polymerase sigma factor [Anaerolineae bacterium]